MNNKSGSPKWTDKKLLLVQLRRLWDKGLLLQDHLCASDFFPKRLVFKSPDSKALGNEFASVRCWIGEIQKLSGFRIVYKTINHRMIGENSIPCEAWLDDLEIAIQLLNKQQEIAVFSQLLAQTQQRAPQLIDWIQQYPLKALSLANVWTKLLDIVLWRQQHPNPNIYLRQVSLPGIDTKFFERYKSTLTALLDRSLPEDQINTETMGVGQFELRYGFLKKTEKIRFRLFEPEMAKLLISLPATDMDFSLTAQDFQCLDQNRALINSVHRVFITENEINFLTFPNQKNSLLIFGSGYGFNALAQAQWLSQKEIFYWGDIDTHGFAILDQLRGKFPHVKSLLMDDETLLMAHQDFWGQEDKQNVGELHRLLPDEQKLYQALLSNQFQKRLRLEQERVNFDYLLAALKKLKT